MTDSDKVLSFWFGENSGDAEAIAEKSSLWWGKGAETDNIITKHFGGLLNKAKAGDLDHWISMPKGRLALIIILDQFSRNIYRGRPESFAQDEKALKLALEGLAAGEDKELRLVEKVFFYMPLEHSEDNDIQNRSVSCFQSLFNQASGDEKSAVSEYLNYAEKHRDIIRHFNRFPHRNEILGRQSTPEELEFLKLPGSSF